MADRGEQFGAGRKGQIAKSGAAKSKDGRSELQPSCFLVVRQRSDTARRRGGEADQAAMR